MQTLTFPWVNTNVALQSSNDCMIAIIGLSCASIIIAVANIHQLAWIRTGLHAESHGIVANVRFQTFFITNNLYALRISGIPFQRKSFTIINQTVLTFLNGGLVNLLSYTPLWCNSPTDLQQMWETAMKAGILTANLMWWVWTACIYLGFIDSKAWTHQNFNGCFTNIHGALEGIFDPRVLYLV